MTEQQLDPPRRWPQFVRAVIVFLGTEVLANTLTDIVAANTNVIVKPAASLWLNTSLASLVALVFWVWDQGQLSLKRLSQDFRHLTASHYTRAEEAVHRVADVLLFGRIGQTFEDLSTRVVSASVKTYVTQLPAEDRIERNVETLAKELSAKVRSSDYWYPILNRFLAGEARGLHDGHLSIDLKCYLAIYLDLMRLFIDRATQDGHRLHVWSFTNAIPSDWFAGDPHVSGNVMTTFSTQKAGLINEMRSRNFEMRMITLAVPTTGPPGIHTENDVLQSWLSLGEGSRDTYLQQLHTAPSDALVAVIAIEDLSFFGDLSEFIFFGLGPATSHDSRDGEIRWHLCIAGGYSSQNQVLPARYLFLEAEESRFILDVPNRSKVKRSSELSAQARLQVSFKEWPDFVLRERGFGTISVEKYTNLASFAEKWHLAATIWHSDRERAEILEFLQVILEDKTKVLDAAAGTGFHTEILLEMQKDVTALEVSNDEKDILLRRLGSKGLRVVMGDWRELPMQLAKQFDGVICLGSSLPYHSSWTEVRVKGDDSAGGSDGLEHLPTRAANESVLHGVIRNLQRLLSPGGVLVLGLSRHNEKSRTSVGTEFEGDVKGNHFKMKWTFDFDWETRRRLWRSQILGNGREYRFQLNGHLFDHEELRSICLEFFDEAVLHDLNPEHYDKYVVCSKPKTSTL